MQVYTNINKDLKSGQHVNAAGGYSYTISPQERFERFLILGSDSGTFYASSKALTLENTENIKSFVASNGAKALEIIEDVLLKGRAPRPDAAIYALSLVISQPQTSPDAIAAVQAAYKMISKVCKTSTQLFMLLANLRGQKKWSAGLRKGVANFYLERTVDNAAFQIKKYPSRCGYTHKDVIRLSHPKVGLGKDARFHKLFLNTLGKLDAESTEIANITNAELAKNGNEESLVPLIKECRLPWEFVPTNFLNNKAVLTALVEHMPANALVRNLNRLSYTGVLDDSKYAAFVCMQLSNQEWIAKSKIHPLKLMTAYFQYKSGASTHNGKIWTPYTNVVNALEIAIEHSFKASKPSDKNIVVAIDISNSMSEMTAFRLSCAEMAAMVGLYIIKTEPNSKIMAFNTTVVKTPVAITRETKISQLSRIKASGGTDCLAPLRHLLVSCEKVDGLIIITDNETWYGKNNSEELLKAYRTTINPDIKIMEIAMTATNSSSFRQDDPNLLRITGFDANAISLVSSFVGHEGSESDSIDED